MSLSQFMSCRLTRWLALMDSVSDATCLPVIVPVTCVMYVLSAGFLSHNQLSLLVSAITHYSEVCSTLTESAFTDCE